MMARLEERRRYDEQMETCSTKPMNGLWLEKKEVQSSESEPRNMLRSPDFWRMKMLSSPPQEKITEKWLGQDVFAEAIEEEDLEKHIDLES